ncbi:MAG: M1 family aminopeptidase [Bacteroidota bacterium]
MIFKKQVFVFLFTLLFGSCNLFKQSGNKDVPVVVNLDTIEALGKTPEIDQYQATASRINDILHTKLDVSFDWTKQYLYGKATITVRPYFYPTSTLILDARGMELKEVALITTATKAPLEYTYENDIITIKLDKEYKNTEQYTLFIDYIAKPNELKKGGGSAAITDDKGLYFINPEGKEKDKPQQIWTQGETQSSSVWFPTIDRPNERMTQEIYITVSKKFVTLSNGELVFSTDNGDSTRTDYWKMEQPHAPYLTMMAIGEFAMVKDKWKDMEVNYYVEKEYEPHAKAIFGNTPAMIEFFSNKLGVPYPWIKYSQIVARDYVSGAMENTTATLHGDFMQRTDRELLDRTNEDVISHELFHQWFGDLVTCESWSNLPLNESFATYGEYLWEEFKYGLDAADAHSAESRDGYLTEAEHKQKNLIRFQYENKDDMFDAHSYNKGGQVLHMLRKYVGDDAFFASLKLYLETNKFNSVEIHDLRLAFEKVTGEDLNWFFNQWFLSSGHPDLLISTAYDPDNKKQKIQIQQVQYLTKTVLFKLPMSVDLYSNGKVERKKIVVTKTNETFEFDALQQPDLVNVDAEKMLLCTKEEEKSIKEWAFQYTNAPLYLDRYEALTGLAKQAKDSISTQILISALSDKFWGIRADVISILKEVHPGFEKQIKNKLIALAEKDERSSVRSTAIDYLSANFKDDDLQKLYTTALNDKAYSVLGSALMAITKSNPQEGLQLAKKYENEKNNDVLSAIAGLYSTYGSDENNDFFIKGEKKFLGFSKISFINEYASFLLKAKNDATINSGVEVLSTIAKDEGLSKWISYYAKKSIHDLATMYDSRINSITQKLKEKNSDVIELGKQLESDKAQKEKIMDVYNNIK